MGKLINLSKIILFTGLFLILKYLTITLYINNVILFKAFEIILFFIISYLFSLFTDYSRIKIQEKLETSLKCAIIFTAISFVLSIIKLIFSHNLIIIGICNFLQFGLLGALPYIRDNYFHNDIDSNNTIVNIVYVSYFIFIKFLFNLLIILFFSNGDFDLDKVNYYMIFFFSVSVFLIRPIVQSIFMKGFIEYDGIEHPVFSKFIVGRYKKSDIIIEDREPEKSIFFTISASKKWFLYPSEEMKIDNKIIIDKTEIDDEHTIKFKNNYFTISHNKGNFIKRFFLLFIMIFMISTFFYANDIKKELLFDRNEEIVVANADFSNYPLINAFINIDQGKNPATFYKKENFFVIENDRKGLVKNIEVDNSPLDLVFVLDVTGSMYDTIHKFQNNFSKMIGSLKKSRKNVRVGIITFADKENEMKMFELTDDMGKIDGYLNKIEPQAGGDFSENPYDAIFKLEKFKFNINSQKIVILLTDATPHIKGDKANHGVDITTKSTDDVYKFIHSSSFLFYVLSYFRFSDYQKLINSNPYQFFDMEKYDDFSEILNSLEASIKTQIKITYTTSQSKNFYENGGKNKIMVFKDEDAIKAKKIFDAGNIKKTSFFESLFGNF